MTKHRSAAAENRFGILCMSAAMALFIANDGLTKYVSATMPAAQLIFLRGLASIVVVLLVAKAMGVMPQLPSTANRRVVARAVVDATATMLYLFSLFHLPIANATAINLASPLFMIVFAVLFLGHHVGLGRWLAIGAGFAGVVLVIQPRADGFNFWAWVCLSGTLFHAARDLMTPRIATHIPSILITLSTAIAVTVVSGVVSIFEGWKPFGWFELSLLALASVFLSSGYFFIITSMRHGEMSLVAPFRYSGLLFALVLGYLVWNETPNALAWGGIAVLIGSGVYLLMSDRARAPAAATAAVAAAAVPAASKALTNVDLTGDAAATRYVKDEVVEVTFAATAGEITSAVGVNRYAAGDALVTGSTGDRWSVSRDRFDARYLPEGMAMGEPGPYRNRPVPVLARQMHEPFTVARSAGGDVLTGNAGDWLLQYAPGDFGVIDRTRFERVYRLLS
jgi:drug/metabolite transporter (DMT)-like permease